MLVVFDFQNYWRICREANIGILPGQLVNHAAQYLTHHPREVELASLDEDIAVARKRIHNIFIAQGFILYRSASVNPVASPP